MDKHEIEKLRRKAMTRNQIRITVLSGFALGAALTASRPVAAQDAKQPYPNMAPIDQYLMARDAEIALARSAAPDAISQDASVIVLTRHGYETTGEGKNGWVCWVGRGWMGMFDHPEFWNPKVRAAECINPPAVPLRPDLCLQTHRIAARRPFQARSHRRNQSRNRQKRITSPGAGDCLLHDVEGFVSQRLRRAQHPPPEVFRNKTRR